MVDRLTRSDLDGRERRHALSTSDWVAAAFSFVVVCILIAFITALGLQVVGIPIMSALGLGLFVLVPPILSAANAALFLRGRIRKHVAALRAEEVVVGRYCRCGYDLTGNESGVCPECGTETVD